EGGVHRVGAPAFHPGGGGGGGGGGQRVEPPALGGQVPGGKGQGAVPPGGGQRAVRGDDGGGLGQGQGDHRVPGEAQLVEDQHAGAVGADPGGQRTGGLPGDLPVVGQDPVVLLGGHPVNFGQRRAGQDVVELVEQGQLPVVAQRLGRVGEAGAAAGQGGQRLGGQVGHLGPAVGLFGPRLGGEDPPVVFEV